jgi:ATP-dependent DNA helicase DinG
MSDYIDQVFGRTGILAKAFKGYEPREGQVKLARAVESAIVSGSALLAEAPTGTGKSVAYAVPATFHASKNNPLRGELPCRRVCIVTANIALQEQLVEKDLPLLQKLLPWEFTFALAKGRGNYLCLDRFDDYAGDIFGERDPALREQWEQIVHWSVSTEKGDLSELPFEPSAALRSKFTITSDDCTAKKCNRYLDCFAEKARKEFAKADVIVTNYHMLFAHLVVLDATEGTAGVLPPFDLVICDEGHKMADVARDFFGAKVTHGAIRWATRLLAGTDKASRSKKSPIPAIAPELRDKIRTLSDNFFGALRLYKNGEDYKARLKVKEPVEWEELCKALVQAANAYLKASEDSAIAIDRREELRKTAIRTGVQAVAIEHAMKLTSPDVVHYIEEEGEKVILCSRPVHVAAKLREQLFDAHHSTTVTSATLTTSGASFDFVACELGCEEAEELVAPSPFNWQEQATLILPTGICDPNDKRFAEMVAEICEEVVERAHGRTLGLFTSYRILNAVHKHLMQSHGSKYTILRHGTAPRSQLIAQFREDISSVLLGTESFWAGVDVPGEALSAVVIDRIPFPTPDDPVLDAIQGRDPSGWFKNYSIPRATIALRQGFGRLIRSTRDRGVVVCCDRRLVDKPYGKTILRSLPPVRVSRDLADVSRVLDERNP